MQLRKFPMAFTIQGIVLKDDNLLLTECSYGEKGTIKLNNIYS